MVHFVAMFFSSIALAETQQNLYNVVQEKGFQKLENRCQCQWHSFIEERRNTNCDLYPIK